MEFVKYLLLDSQNATSHSVISYGRITCRREVRAYSSLSVRLIFTEKHANAVDQMKFIRLPVLTLH